MYDLLIKNGRVVDGTGRPSVIGDIGVVGDKIVAVGALSGGARSEIDATGLVVTPGFVDIHTHYDGQASWDGNLAPSCHHGVTSTVFGNCGVGFAPARSDKHDWLINLLEGVEDIPGSALAEGLTWNWETFPQFLDALGQCNYTMDIGAQIPHAPLRTYVMGDRGADALSVPTAKEVAEMARLAAEAVAAGALGFSTSRTVAHKTRDGASIGTLRAPESELVAIAEAIGKLNTGVIQLISDAYLSADEAFARSELALIRQISLASRRPLSMTVQQIDGSPDRWRLIYDHIEKMRAEGLAVHAQVAPRPIGLIHCLRTTFNPFALTAGYIALQKLPADERVTRLRDPMVRRQILTEHGAMPLGDVIADMMTGGFDRMFRMTDPVNYEPDLSTSIAMEAEKTGRDPAEYCYDTLLEEDGHRMLYRPVLNFSAGNLAAVHQMMSADFSLFGLSDGGAHCGTVCDASFPTTALALWSRGSKDGLHFPLEYLVHGYSQRNALHVGWQDRGVISPGYLADINIIDLDVLDLPPPEITFDLPAGGMRLNQMARGYRWTIKRGAVTFRDGVATGCKPGRLVRGPQYI